MDAQEPFALTLTPTANSEFTIWLHWLLFLGLWEESREHGENPRSHSENITHSKAPGAETGICWNTHIIYKKSWQLFQTIVNPDGRKDSVWC